MLYSLILLLFDRNDILTYCNFDSVCRNSILRRWLSKTYIHFGRYSISYAWVSRDLSHLLQPETFQTRAWDLGCCTFSLRGVLVSLRLRSRHRILPSMSRIEWQMSFQIFLRDRLELPVAFSHRILCHSSSTPSIPVDYTYHAVSRCEIIAKNWTVLLELNNESDSSKLYSQLIDIFLCNWLSIKDRI